MLVVVVLVVVVMFLFVCFGLLFLFFVVVWVFLGGGVFLVFLLLNVPATCKVHLKDGSAWTFVCFFLLPH